jgi:succinate dehydrogenase/fumarate reductase flavoprotein subunit
VKEIRLADHADHADLTSGVLVIGGGLAGAWAALSAARRGADVILVDKGYRGTSGVTATAGVGHWYLPPEARAAAADAPRSPVHPREPARTRT